MRRSIERMVEGYDAADPERASTLALRDEWMVGGQHTQGASSAATVRSSHFLSAECRDRGVAIRLGAAVSAIEEINGSALVRCENGDVHDCRCRDPHRATSHRGTRSCFRRRNARGRRRLPKSASATSSRSCCGLRPRGGYEGRSGSRGSDVPVVGCENSGLVDAASGRSAAAHGLVRGPEDGSDGNLCEHELVRRRARVARGNLRPQFRSNCSGDLVAARAINWAHDPLRCAAPIHMRRRETRSAGGTFKVRRRGSSSPAKHFIAGGTWARSRRRWRAV